MFFLQKDTFLLAKYAARLQQRKRRFLMLFLSLFSKIELMEKYSQEFHMNKKCSHRHPPE
jgi:hypothetical protein